MVVIIMSGIIVIGASQSKPHASGKLGTVVTYTNDYEQFSFSVGKIVYLAKKQTQFTDASYLIGRVICVVKNNEYSLPSFHIGWYGCSCHGE